MGFGDAKLKDRPGQPTLSYAAALVEKGWNILVVLNVLSAKSLSALSPLDAISLIFERKRPS